MSEKQILTQQEGKAPFKKSPYRFVCLILFACAAFVNSYAPQTFVAINVITRDLYNVSEVVINLNGLAYSLMQIFIVFPANYILDQIGLKQGLNISCFFMCLGYGIRLFINYHFWIFLLGTFITSFGFIFILISATKFTNIWFPVSQIPVVNAIILFILFASDAFGVFTSALVINNNSTKQNMFDLVLWQSIVIGAIHILILLFFKAKPQHPANYSSQVKKQQYLQSIKALIKNKNYLICLLSTTFTFGAISSIFVTMGYQLEPFGLSDQVGNIIIISNITGLIGCALGGIYIQKTRKYKLAIIICSFVGCTFFSGMMIITTIFQSTYILYTFSAFGGLCLFPYLTTMIELSNQVSFPVGEATSSGFLLCGGQLFGFFLGLGLSFYIDGNSKKTSIIGAIIYIFCLFSGAFCSLFLKQDLKKLKYEENKGKVQTSEDITQSIITNEGC